MENPPNPPTPSGVPMFHHAATGMTRFPPNVEQITVVRESGVTWLIARRNDVALRFPLDAADRAHLVGLLTIEVRES